MENGTGTCQPHNRPSNQTLKPDPQKLSLKTGQPLKLDPQKLWQTLKKFDYPLKSQTRK